MNTKKFIFKMSSLCFLSILIFMSCRNDNEDIIIDSPNAMNGLEVMTYGFYGKSGKSSAGTTIASFSDKQAYNNYIANLEAQVEAWDDAFVAQWGHLDEESLNLKEEALGFDSEKPLTDFENHRGLNSLRKQYLAEEEVWLNNDVLNDAIDPDNKPEYDFDDNEMAVINNLAEVKIGTTIYKQLNGDEIIAINNAIQRKSIKKSMPVVQEGAMLEIGDGDFNTLIDFNNGDTDVIDNGNVSINNTGAPGTGCESGKAVRIFIPISNNRRIKAIVKARRGFGGPGKVKAKMKSYKKKGRRWKKRRANISAGLNGEIRDYKCLFVDLVDDKKRIKKKKKSKFHWKDKNSLGHPNVENGGMKGTYYINGINKELILEW